MKIMMMVVIWSFYTRFVQFSISILFSMKKNFHIFWSEFHWETNFESRWLDYYGFLPYMRITKKIFCFVLDLHKSHTHTFFIGFFRMKIKKISSLVIVSHYVYIYFEIVEFSFEKDCCCFFKQFIQLHLRNLILFFSMSNVLVRKENCQFHYYVTWMMMINTFNVFRMTILDFVWSINILNDLRLYLNWKN